MNKKALMKKTRSIKNREIDEFPFDDEEFESLLQYVRNQNFPIFETRNVNPIFFKKADVMLWRAQDLYIFRDRKSGRKLISQHDIFHPAIHHILVTKYGHQLKGRPLFTLLCEVIATSSEYYFMLKNINRFGVRKTEEENIREYLRGYDELSRRSAAKSLTVVRNRIETGLKNPYKAFQEAVLEGFKFYEESFKIATNRGETFDIYQVLRLCRPGKYRFIFTRYFWSANMTYALANCGSKSGREDQLLVKKCLKTLSEAKTFTQFLEKLGLNQYQAVKRRAA